MCGEGGVTPGLWWSVMRTGTFKLDLSMLRHNYSNFRQVIHIVILFFIKTNEKNFLLNFKVKHERRICYDKKTEYYPGVCVCVFSGGRGHSQTCLKILFQCHVVLLVCCHCFM